MLQKHVIRCSGAFLLLSWTFFAAGAVGRTITWRNPATYQDNSQIPENLRTTIETGLYYSTDRDTWTRFATVVNGGESWTGSLPVQGGITGYYSATSTVPGEWIESPMSIAAVFPPPATFNLSGSEDEVRVVVGNYEDTYVNVGRNSNINYSSEPVIRTYTWPEHSVANRGFLKWDLSSLPSDANVTGATLRLYYVDEEGGGGSDSYVVPVAKVTDANPDLRLVTWNSPNAVHGWSGGADGGARDLAPAESTASVGKNHGWVVWNVANMVQQWVEAPGTNHGMALDSDTKAAAGSNRIFASREHPDPLLHPELVITYRRSPQGALQQGSVVPSSPWSGAEAGAPADTFTVEIGRYEDTYVNLGSYSDTNFSFEPLICTYTWPKNNVANRGFIQWDLSGLPSGINVKNATLWLYYIDEEGGGGDDEYTVSVSKVNNVRSVLDMATWNTYDGFSPWPGGQNGGAEAMAPVSSSSTVGKTHRWVSWDVTGMVREWAAYPGTNFGMAIDSDASASPDSNRFFASREYSDPLLRPRLVITYTINR